MIIVDLSTYENLSYTVVTIWRLRQKEMSIGWWLSKEQYCWAVDDLSIIVVVIVDCRNSSYLNLNY